MSRSEPRAARDSASAPVNSYDGTGAGFSAAVSARRAVEELRDGLARTDAAANVTVAVQGLQVTVSADAPAMYVVLTTAAHGRFEDNAFLLLPSKPMQVDFVPFGALDMPALTKSLRVEDVSAYM